MKGILQMKKRFIAFYASLSFCFMSLHSAGSQTPKPVEIQLPEGCSFVREFTLPTPGAKPASKAATPIVFKTQKHKKTKCIIS